ncbi:MAG: serine--tRNA ligase [Patescibacteria group bacterium]|nr:serine--tRNA ligase [Patescibacteria group bacterium]MDE2172810.1 serine--tRNA ligase [Patescibacteria group bacterium]
MLDIKFIRENRDVVAAAVKNKHRSLDIDQLIAVHDRKKALSQQVDELNRARNEAARLRDAAKGAELKKQAETLEADLAAAEKEYISYMLQVPNIPSVDTPIGEDESKNKVLRQWGDPPKFSFKPKEHHELAETLGILDTATAATVSGSRFAYLKGDLVLLQFALLQYCLKVLTDVEILGSIATNAGASVKIKPFVPILPPVFVKPAVQNRMARFLTPEEHYMFPHDDLMLVGSAEHTLGPMHMDTVFTEDQLPVRYAGYSTAFRREAGSHGKDTKGILRQHQFDKLEMESFVLPEQSVQEQDFLVAIQEHILQMLKLPYQVVIVCTGDMGFPDNRQIDIETWMPGQNRYRETHSADLTASFQSRRLNTRVKRGDGKIEPVHMNDATAVAFGRTLIAIIENYQQADGSVKIPEVLRPYFGGEAITR